MPKVTLSGGSQHGRTIMVLHGASVRIATTGEVYDRPKDGGSVWKLSQIEAERQ